MSGLLLAVPAMGLGELPGSDAHEASRIAVGEFPELPSVPVLPSRGPWATATGRSCFFLAELYVDLQPGGWRLVARPGMDARRRDSLLRSDLDAFEEALENAAHGPIKTSMLGPWTLAAILERHQLGPALADPGAVRDLAGSLAEGVSLHVRELRRRFVRDVVVQLDEPLLLNVVEGSISTASGLGRLAAVDPTLARAALASVREAAHAAGAEVICRVAGAQPMVELTSTAGFAGLCVDSAGMGPAHEDSIATYIEAGGILCAGSPYRAEAGRHQDLLSNVVSLWRRLGLEPALGATRVVATHEDGVVDLAPAAAIAMMKSVRDAGIWMRSEPEEWIA